jgi:hypothetical protein
LRPGPTGSPVRRLPPHTPCHCSAPIWLWLFLGFPDPLWSSVFRVSFFPPPVSLRASTLNLTPKTLPLSSTPSIRAERERERETAETATRVSVTTSILQTTEGRPQSFIQSFLSCHQIGDNLNFPSFRISFGFFPHFESSSTCSRRHCELPLYRLQPQPQPRGSGVVSEASSSALVLAFVRRALLAGREGGEHNRAHGVFVRLAFLCGGGSWRRTSSCWSFDLFSFYQFSISEKSRGRVEGFAWKHCCLPCLRSF